MNDGIDPQTGPPPLPMTSDIQTQDVKSESPDAQGSFRIAVQSDQKAGEAASSPYERSELPVNKSTGKR